MCLAQPAKIKSLDKSRNVASVDFGGGVEREVSLGILQGVLRGDYVLIHAGFAIGKLEDSEARDMLNALKELKEGI